MNIVEQFLISKATENHYFQMSFGGEILDISKSSCRLTEPSEMGCVYGIAIKIVSPQIKKYVFNQYSTRHESLADLSDWRRLNDTNFYPLYWGKDVTSGSRLKAHVKKSKSTGALHLLEEQFSGLSKYLVIYGGVLCSKRGEFEKWLHQSYPDLLQGYTHPSSTN